MLKRVLIWSRLFVAIKWAIPLRSPSEFQIDTWDSDKQSLIIEGGGIFVLGKVILILYLLNVRWLINRINGLPWMSLCNFAKIKVHLPFSFIIVNNNFVKKSASSFHCPVFNPKYILFNKTFGHLNMYLFEDLVWLETSFWEITKLIFSLFFFFFYNIKKSLKAFFLYCFVLFFSFFFFFFF
jgi:hypothetical protein